MFWRWEAACLALNRGVVCLFICSIVDSCFCDLALNCVAVYVSRYLGTQLGDERSISQVAKRFMGTGMLPEPSTTAPDNAPVGRAVGAGPPPPPPPLPPPPPPLLGFRKAARTPPLSTAAAIITSTTECRTTKAGAAGLCALGAPAPAPPVSDPAALRSVCTGLEMQIGGAGRGELPLIGGSTTPLHGLGQDCGIHNVNTRL